MLNESSRDEESHVLLRAYTGGSKTTMLFSVSALRLAIVSLCDCFCAPTDCAYMKRAMQSRQPACPWAFVCA